MIVYDICTYRTGASYYIAHRRGFASLFVFCFLSVVEGVEENGSMHLLFFQDLIQTTQQQPLCNNTTMPSGMDESTMKDG
jgi:hypothetical protein